MAKAVGGVHRKKKRRKKKVTGRNDGPARKTYWRSGRLEARKVKALMEHNGMTRSEAVTHWRETRTSRVKT